MKFTPHNPYLLVAVLAMFVVMVYAYFLIPYAEPDKERSAYTGGFCIGVLFGLLLSAWAIS